MLFGLGIEEVGYVIGRNLAQHFRTIDALLGATPEEIEQAQGVGPKMAAKIHEQLHDEQMGSLIEDLRELGLTLEEAGPPPGEGPLAGKTFVLTGTLPDADSRAGDRDDRGRRWPGHRLGVAQDRLCGRRRERGLEARPGGKAGRVRCSTRTGLRALLA